jgi:ribosomal protein S12 methylthiotransferase accessory factor
MQLSPRLKSSPKRSGFHRICTPEETYARVHARLRDVGITRLSDITGLDRLGIPIWSSVVPKSRDVLSVYNGKGSTDISAKVGAIMEAVERSAGCTFSRPFLRGSFRSMSARRRVLDPEVAGPAIHPQYTKDLEILWTEGHDLFTGEEVLVPADVAGYNAPCCDDASVRAYQVSTTNGLASGNTYEEAIAQALCELIERDAWTVAQVLAHWRPRAKFEADLAKAGKPKHKWDPKADQPFDDDGDRYPIVSPETFTGEVREVYQRFVRADLPPTMRDITSDIGIPTFVVNCTEDVSAEIPRAHLGLGTHHDPEVAAMRALTELAQSRVVDIQGVREDMSGADEKVSKYMSHTKRTSQISKRIWYHMDTTNRRSMADVPSVHNDDTRDDIRGMLEALDRNGVHVAL